MEQIGQLHAAKDKAKQELELMKKKYTELEISLAVAKEKNEKEKEACIGWEAEAKRYEIVDGQINAATSNVVLTAFLRDERCGNLFRRVSESITGEVLA